MDTAVEHDDSTTMFDINKIVHKTSIMTHSWRINMCSIDSFECCSI